MIKIIMKQVQPYDEYITYGTGPEKPNRFAPDFGVLKRR